mgnify:CR=1 FL=1
MADARVARRVLAREGTTVFMVPLGTPGFRIGKVFNKAGWRFYQNAELIFENARVPHANLVGEPHKGQKVRSGVAAEFSDFELAANEVPDAPPPLETAMAKLYSADRDVRRAAAEGVTEALQPTIRTRTSIFNTILVDKWIDDRLRGYPTWITSRNLANETSDCADGRIVQRHLDALRK